MFRLLADISMQSAENNMSVENIARIFAPTLLRSSKELSSDAMTAFAEVSLHKILLQRLIDKAVKSKSALDLSSLHLSARMMSRMQNRQEEHVDSVSSQDEADAVDAIDQRPPTDCQRDEEKIVA